MLAKMAVSVVVSSLIIAKHAWVHFFICLLLVTQQVLSLANQYII